MKHDASQVGVSLFELKGPTFGSGPALGPAAQADQVVARLDVKDSTKAVYKYGLRDFIAWNEGLPLSRDRVSRYKVSLRSRSELSTSTKNLYLSAVRALTAQLFAEGLVEADFGKHVRGFSVNRAHKREAISDEQVGSVFQYLKAQDDPTLTLVFTLLFFQGLRQHEVLSVRVEDFNASSKTLAIEGKGRDEREAVDLHPTTVEVLEWFLRRTGIRSGYLLASSRSATGYMSRVHLNRLIREVHKKCKVNNSGHAWRKVFTSKLIESGLDLLTVSSFTRHRSIEMLKVYYDRLDRKKKLPTFYRTFSLGSTSLLAGAGK